MKEFLGKSALLIMEGAIIERLRRSANTNLHPVLLNAPLIYDEKGRDILRTLYQEYIDIACQSNLPILLCTPTWRTSKERVDDSCCTSSINVDAGRYMQELRNSTANNNSIIRIGGLIGCKNDCYIPEEGLSVSEAETFHLWQLEQLTQGNVDFLIGATLPNVGEALGIARAMERVGKPYIISFVISRDGRVLDGTSLLSAVEYIDSETIRKPLGYMVNCAHPTFLCAAEQPEKLFSRLIGYQANASSLDHCELDCTDQLQSDSVSEWGELMLELNDTYGVKILGGCCGTDGGHLHYIVNNYGLRQTRR